MSLVGPRPEVAEYVDMFHDDYEAILAVRPGMTDFASLEYCDEAALLEQIQLSRRPSLRSGLSAPARKAM